MTCDDQIYCTALIYSHYRKADNTVPLSSVRVIINIEKVTKFQMQSKAGTASVLNGFRHYSSYNLIGEREEGLKTCTGSWIESSLYRKVIFFLEQMTQYCIF